MEIGHLAIHESVLLLGLDDLTGKRTSQHLNLAVAGGAVAELARRDRVVARTERKKVFLEGCDRTPTGQPLLDQVLATITDSRKRRQIHYWIQRLAQISEIEIRAADRLVMAGVLRLEEKQMLKVLTLKRLPQVQPHLKAELTSLIDRAFSGGHCDRATATVVGLAVANQLIEPVGDRTYKRQWRAYAERLTSGDVFVSEAKRAFAAASEAMAG